MYKVKIHTSRYQDVVFGFVLLEDYIENECNSIVMHQTDGVLCHQVEIEGIYCPLPEPYSFDKDSNLVKILSEYNYDPERVEEYNSVDQIWSDINDKLFFDYQEVNNLKLDYPTSSEGVKWIKITDIEDEQRYCDNYNEILEEDIVIPLLYQNSD